MDGGSKAGGDLQDIVQQFWGETTPTRQGLIDQYYEALTTGGVGARMPIISKAQEQSRTATSNAMRALDTQLAQSGLSGTPFGERTRSQTMMQGEQATAAVPANIIQAMLQQIPGFVTGANQTVVSGMGSAAGAEAQQSGANAQWLGAMMSPFRYNF